MGHCDRCDGPIPNTRVSITLGVADKGQLQGDLCSIGCALDWLAMTPAKLKGMGAKLPPQPWLERHREMFAAFEADN